MPTTMRDVALKAGVSIKTVSRVVNDSGEISDATRQRVLAAIDELGYRPSRLARALVTQRSHTVGLLVADIINPFFPEVARGVLDAAQTEGYNVFLCNTDGDPEQELHLLHSLADHAVDGIIIYPSYESGDYLRRFAAHYRPLVVINHYFEQPGVSPVMVDHQRGAKLAVEYLIGQGHLAIGMLSGVRNPSLGRVRRIQGFKEALSEHGLPVVEEWIVANQEPSFADGYASARQLLSQYPQITAIFAYNDLLALGAIRACNDMGRRVPTDCAIVGFDDIPWAATSIPTLTTVRVDKYNLGYQAMIRLLEMLEQPELSFPSICLDVELIIRESA
jgi:LacI family transcriptional regulator